MSLTIGSLCSGYGGLDLAVEWFYGARTIWHAEIDPAMSKVLAARWPGVPNLGNLKLIHYGRVPRVDIVTAGYPCQPFSHAGRRGGVDDPRHLWPYVAQAVRRVRPRIVVLENVAGHRSLGFGDVLADLATAGYDARWTSLRAADVGAPHGRERLFIMACDTGSETVGLGTGLRTVGASGQRWGRSDDDAAPDAADSDGEGSQGRKSAPGRHMPDRGAAADSSSDGRHEGRTEPAGQLGRLDAAERSAVAPDTEHGASAAPWRRQVGPGEAERTAVAWGQYESAIRRWERLTRPAPAPTETGPKGGQRLAPRFVEWMQGLPDGWVTDVPGLTRNEMLRGLGNGVVPQQAFEAQRRLDAMAFEAGAA